MLNSFQLRETTNEAECAENKFIIQNIQKSKTMSDLKLGQ